MSSEETDTEVVAEPTASDIRRDELAALIRAEIGSDVKDIVIERSDIWIRVDKSAWRRTIQFCKAELGLDYFCFLSGLDWLPAPDMSAEKMFTGETEVEEETEEGTESAASAAPAAAEMTTGVAGGDTRFQVFARLLDIQRHVGITLKADLDDNEPSVDSIHDVFAGSNWHEREAHEMYGFNFEGHPDLRNLYLPTGFEGHPLRKDFPLLARELKPWPGLVDVEPLPAGLDEVSETEGGE